MRVIRHPKLGDGIDCAGLEHPAKVSIISGAYAPVEPCATAFWYVLTGSATIQAEAFDLKARAGTFGACADAFSIHADGLVVLFERPGHRGVTCAGRIERVGRLKFIDGCSDTILVSPPRLGDPVLNHLHIPPGVCQSQHFHTSVRLGVVIGGAGIADIGEQRSKVALTASDVFCVDPYEVHSFRTTDEWMDIVVFHPDSDWGPTDEVHPMRTRSVLLAEASESA